MPNIIGEIYIMLKRHKRGFTLIELLVVIAIIAILLSILVPTLGKAKRIASMVICQSRLRQWGLIFSMYVEENNNHFFEGWYEGCDNSGVWPFVVWPWREDNPALSYCPMAKKTMATGASSPYAAWGTEGGQFYGSYGINSWVLSPPSQVIETEGHLMANNWRRMDVKGAGRVPLLLDSQWVDGWPEDFDEPLATEDSYWKDSDEDTLNHMRRFSVNRHDEKLNTLFLDCSLQRTGVKQLWTLKWHRDFKTAGQWTTAGGVKTDDWPEWLRGFKAY